MPGGVFLQNDTVSLRPVEETDLAFCRDAVNNPAVRGSIESARPMNLLTEDEWFEETSTSAEEIVLLICVDDEPVGIVGLSEIDGRAGTAEIGYLVVPAHWSNGYATAAVELMVEYAIGELRLNRIQAHVYTFNPPSRRVLEKVGFTEEGVHREGDFVDGTYVDVHVYGLLAAEWAG